MWIRSSGKITENSCLINTYFTSHLLVYSEKVVLFDAGLYATASELNDSIKSFLPADTDVDYLYLSHAHFDHVGGIPFFRKAYPKIKIVSSKATAKLLKNKSLLSDIYAQNSELLEDIDLSEKDFIESIFVDEILNDGQVMSLGALDEEITVSLYETSGHTEDSSCYLIKPDKLVYAGDSLGYYGGRGVVGCMVNSNYYDQLASIDRVSAMDIIGIVLGHSGAITGELMLKYLSDTRIELERFASNIKDRISQGQLQEAITASILVEMSDLKITPDGPFKSSHEALLRDMIKLIANTEIS